MMMEAPLAYPDSPMEDDTAYPCKGCGKILEEGKAFELAGNRWHIDCFRCNTCGTLLDSDANLLLLGDGSLICNNCTYSCSACGNKIEDLAILTGDHAFCASCFRCRNCKKQIENLRYARTSQGIFCMECHEGLMARRRKKSKNSSGRQKQASNNMLLEKSLPSLPPGAVSQSVQSAFSPERETPPSDAYSDTPTELPASQPKKSSKSRAAARDRSPAVSEEDRRDNLTLPSTTYDNRHSAHSQRSNISTGDDYYIPMALDPNPAPGPSPLSRHQNIEIQESTKQASRDYFSTKVPHSSSRKVSQEPENSRPTSSRGTSQPGSPQTPHIAYQEKGREPTSEVLDSIRKRSASGALSGLANGSAPDKSRETPTRNGTKDSEKFKLQEVPKRRKSGSSARNSRSELISPSIDTSMGDSQSKSAPASANVNVKEHHITITSSDSPNLLKSDSTSTGSPRLSQDSKATEVGSMDSSKSYSSPKSGQLQNLPQRGDSLHQSLSKQPAIARKEVAGPKYGSSPLSADGGQSHMPLTSASSLGAQDSPKSSANINGGRLISAPIESPISKSSSDFMQPPARAKDRPSLTGPTSGDSFVSPRAPPHPPMEIHSSHKGKNESISTLQSADSTRNGDVPASPTLPRYSAGGEFSMAEDMARILGTEEQDQDQASFLRRVSNSVRHARSYSDRGTRLSREQKWSKSPLNGTASGKFTPTSSSPEAREDLGHYMTELRKLRQMNMDKDQEIAELKLALDGKANIHQLNSELRKKRSTMVVLDTQKDLVIRELEVMTDHTAKAKKAIDRGEPLDVGGLTNVILRDFAETLHRLKDGFTPQIEDLREKKVKLTEEITSLTQDRDKALHEFEQTSAKNSQLAELNNQLVHQIQGMQALLPQPRNQSLDTQLSAPQGLGIYTQHSKDKSSISMDSREFGSTPVTGSTLNLDPDNEATTILSAPRVVDIRKIQPKKFNWKKGGQNVAKVTKGLKGAFTTTAPNNSNELGRTQREGSITEGMPYGAMTQGHDQPSTSLPAPTTRSDNSRQGGFGFFSNTKPSKSQAKAASNGPSVVAEDPSVLYGSELEQRALYEHAQIPGIVTRCIQEVETRGMDLEGIYRKSGGNSQIQMIKEGFEQNDDFDISDPDLDICAVTSALKQYFRWLPTPLITYTVYDKLLDTTTAHDETSRILLLRAAIKELPHAHRQCLEFLVFHLHRVCDREKENFMTPLNVATVFAPTIMRPVNIAQEMADTPAKNAAVQFLIQNCHAVFLPDGRRSSERKRG